MIYYESAKLPSLRAQSALRVSRPVFFLFFLDVIPKSK